MKKAIVYLRVSSKEQKTEGYSIPAQRKLLWEYARSNKFQVVKEFEDDETAKSAGRNGFGEMIEFLKANKDVENILVEKTDRLYRNFKDYVTIDELGISVFLVKENEVIGKGASSHQKFIHGIKVLMAKNYVDNLSEEVKKGYREKAESGVYPGSNLPLGYSLGKQDNKSVPLIDEDDKGLAIRMFELYATGSYSLLSLRQKLEADGLIYPERFTAHFRRKTLTKSTMHRLLRNPFFYGDFVWNDKLYTGTHEPLIKKELWDKVQANLDRFEKKQMLSKHQALPFAFKGLFICGECGRSITAEKKIKKSGKEYTYYHCTKFETNCSQKAINETVIETQIATTLQGLEMPQEAVSYVALGLKTSLITKRATADKTKNNFEEEKKILEDRLDSLYEDKLDGEISKDFYERKASEYSARIKELDGKISKMTMASLDYYDFGSKILELANKASFLYEKANPVEKRELLAYLLSNSTIMDKKALVSYKKPYDKILERASCNDWRGLRDDFRTFNWEEIRVETELFFKTFVPLNRSISNSR